MQKIELNNVSYFIVRNLDTGAEDDFDFYDEAKAKLKELRETRNATFKIYAVLEE